MVGIQYGIGTYETKVVFLWMVLDVLRQVSARDPIRDQVKGRRSDGNTQEGDNVRMFQVFPSYNSFVKILWVFPALASRK